MANDDRRFFRLLVIEDDYERERVLKSWLPPDVKTVVAGSAGRAIGILERDRGNVYAGILLDHDLQGRTATSTDCMLDGKDIANVIVKNVSKNVPILVHSMNVSQAPVMARRLEKDGFSVTRIPMANLTRRNDCRSGWARPGCCGKMNNERLNTRKARNTSTWDKNRTSLFRWHAEDGMTKIIALTSQVNGTAHAKLTVKMSESLATAGKRVLIIDLDDRGTLTDLIGIDRTAITNTSYDFMTGRRSLDEVRKRFKIAGIEVVPAGSELLNAEIALFEMSEREHALSKAISSCNNSFFDYIFIDCPPSPGLITMNALTAAHGVIISVQPEHYSHKDLSDLWTTITLVKMDLNFALTIECVLLVVSSLGSNLAKQVLRDMSSIFRNHFFTLNIPWHEFLNKDPIQ